MKKNTIRTALFIALLLMGGYSVNAQNKELKVGTNPTIKQSSAVLEVESVNKGMLMPRVALTDIEDTVTITSPANALTVFNTSTAGTAPNDVTPGYYYWSTVESKWIRLLNQNDVVEPWQVEGTTGKAISNTQNIYQDANVGIGDFSSFTQIRAKLQVEGGAVRLGLLNQSENFPSNIGGSDIGQYSGTMGQANLARGTASIAMGNFSRAFGEVSTALGHNTIASSLAETSIGKSNAITTGDGSFPVSTDALFQVGNGFNANGNNAFTILKNAHTAIGVDGTETSAKPTELLDLGGDATTGNGGLKIRNINSAAYTGDVATDNVVVADSAGVLKTIAISAIAPVETNTTLSMTAGQLVYANEHANNANVNLISADADNMLVAGTDGLLFVPEPTAENIYNADGTLTGDRIVTTNSNILRFEGTDGTMKIDNDGESEFLIEAFNSNTARTRLTAGTSDLQIAARPTGNIDISATPNGTNSFSLGTSSSASPTSNVEFYTVGSTRMAITGAGDVAIGASTPTEKLDVQAGNVRVRDINANIGASTDRVVVSDTNGVLKTIPASTFAATNIYNSDGTLTDYRIVSGTEKWLTFQGISGTIEINGNNLRSANTTGGITNLYYRGNIAGLIAQGTSDMLDIRTHDTSAPAPITFGTSEGGGHLSEERMRIEGNGKVGIGVNDPTEKLDIGEGNVRVRDIVSNIGAETDRIVVADVDGILKTVAAPTTTAIRTETTDYAAADADETILVDATAGTVTVSLPATPTVGKKYNVKKIDSTANTVMVNGNGHNIDGTATVSGTLPYQGWVMQYDGVNWFIISRI